MERGPGTPGGAGARSVKPDPAFHLNGFRAASADFCSDRGRCLRGSDFVDPGA